MSTTASPIGSSYHGGGGCYRYSAGNYSYVSSYGYDGSAKYSYGYCVNGCYNHGSYGGASVRSPFQDAISVKKKSIGYMMVGWTLPKPGGFKLNTDGASKGNPGPSYCGGIIRDSNGEWVSGFHRSMGFSSSITAELWALRDGLTIAELIGLEKNQLEVEVDATEVLRIIGDRDHDHGHLTELVSECRCLLENFGVNMPNHVYREANQCADILANIDVVDENTTEDGLTVFTSAPGYVVNKLLADASCKLYPRILY